MMTVEDICYFLHQINNNQIKNINYRYWYNKCVHINKILLDILKLVKQKRKEFTEYLMEFKIQQDILTHKMNVEIGIDTEDKFSVIKNDIINISPAADNMYKCINTLFQYNEKNLYCTKVN